VFVGQRPVPGPGEQLFDEESRHLALEYVRMQREVHGPCGQPLDLVLGQENDGAWVTQEVYCHACAAIRKSERAAQINAGESSSDSLLDGLVFLPVYREDLKRG
jgi:hypothetical protein